MKFGILGPLEVHTATERVRLFGQRERRILAVLLLSAGRVVQTSQLIEAVWDDEATATAKRQIQNVVSGLRRRLRRSGAPAGGLIVAEGAGYLIRVEPDQLDAQVFEKLLSAERAVNDPAEAVLVLRSALYLWRGPALCDVSGRAIQAGAVRLDELRLAAFERCIDLQLVLGRHREVVAELTHMVTEHPTRERVVGQLMTALHRSGRNADALRTFQRLRAHLADELGVNPSPQLQQLHTAILRDDPAVNADARQPAPVSAAVSPVESDGSPRREGARLSRVSMADSGPLDLGQLIGMAIGRVVMRALRWAWQRHEADRTGRELALSLHVAELPALLGTLSVAQRLDVARLFDTVEFENLLIQLLIAQLTTDGESHLAVHEQVRQHLRLRRLPDIHLRELTDTVVAAMDEGCSQARRQIPRLELSLTGVGAPVPGHVAGLAARNDEILRNLSSLDEVNQKISAMRLHIADRYQHVRLPHLDLPWVQWDDLYVRPTLVLDQAGTSEVDMLDLVEPGRKTVVLGNPGVGKSTLAIRLASALARNATDRRAVFVLVLRDLSARMSEGWATLNDCLEHVARVPYHVDFSRTELEYVLLNGNAVVFIDGLDELVDLSQRAKLIDLIEGFARAYPLVSMVVTSRHLGYGRPASTSAASTIRAPRTTSLDPRTFTKVLIRQFNDDQVAGYANRWFAVARRTDSADDLSSPLAASFLSESRSIADLRANPLLLSLLCTSYTRRQHIPRNRAEIYAQCSIMLFNQWDEDRGIPLQMRFRGWLRGAVRYLAWQMLEQGGQPELPRGLIERLLIRFLEERGLHRDEAADEAEKFLKFCSGRAWVLTEVGTVDAEPVLGFAHRTFLEFYAADYLVTNYETADVIWQILRSKLASGEWDMISQIVLQLVDQRSEFGANRILTFALDELAAVNGPAVNHVATFAARALGHVRPSPINTARIVNVSIDNAYRCPVDRRRYGFTDHIVTRQQTADEPLFTILAECLEEAWGEVVKTIAARFADDISSKEQSTRAMALAMAASLTHLINHRAFEHAFAWDDLAIKLATLGSDIPLVPRTTHALPTMLSDIEPVQLDLLLKAVGPAPLFRFSLDLRHVTAPLALLTFSRLPQDAADPGPVGVICEHLVMAPRPWLNSKSWQEQCAEANIELACQIMGTEPEQSKTRLAQYLILLLPYLETAALRDLRPKVGSTASAFIRARALPTHAAFDIRVNLKTQIEHSLHGAPDHYAGFLRHWAERKFSVIGADTA